MWTVGKLFAVADTATHRGSLNEKAAVAAMRPVGCAELEDLIHLPGPLTEDAVLKCLHARFSASQLYVSPNYRNYYRTYY